MQKAFETPLNPHNLIVRNAEQSIVFYSPLAYIDLAELNYSTFLFIGHLRPTDFIVLPTSNLSKGLWLHYKTLFNYKEHQAIWYDFPASLQSLTPDFHLRNLKTFQCKNVIVVSCVLLDELAKACEALGLDAFGDLSSKVPDKRWLHPEVPHSKQKEEFPLAFPKAVKTPRGYTCYSAEDLRSAKRLLNLDQCVIKSATGAGGFDIFFARSEEEFEKTLKQIQFKRAVYPSIPNLSDSGREPAFLLEEIVELQFEKSDFQ